MYLSEKAAKLHMDWTQQVAENPVGPHCGAHQPTAKSIQWS